MAVAHPDPVVALVVDRAVIVVTGQQRPADELKAFLDEHRRSTGREPQEWDLEELGQAFARHFETYAAVDFTADLAHPVLLIARREGPPVADVP